ncbi:MAG: DUF4190 domain-containing protein [Streptosporangiales bacterium]|nr:DUF4190 domain-containing protein [Streptosporangiales bacterium]MBO0890177.1 DUF4190 domain-containing protein [Acidothermales bacterium]
MTTDPTGGQPYDSPPPFDQPPPYGVPQYGQPQGYVPAVYYYQPPPPTNVMAILSLVFALVIAPVGLVLGLIARRQIAESGEEGRGLALAGTIVGAVITGFWVLYAAFWIVMMIVFAAFSS